MCGLQPWSCRPLGFQLFRLFTEDTEPEQLPTVQSGCITGRTAVRRSSTLKLSLSKHSLSQCYCQRVEATWLQLVTVTRQMFIWKRDDKHPVFSQRTELLLLRASPPAGGANISMSQTINTFHLHSLNLTRNRRKVSERSVSLFSKSQAEEERTSVQFISTLVKYLYLFFHLRVKYCPFFCSSW